MSGASPPARLLAQRLSALLAEYGKVALWVYFGIFALVLAGFGLAITFGFNVASAGAAAGTWGAAYVATKLTQPLRIAATLLVTPVVVRLLGKERHRHADRSTAEAGAESQQG